MEGSQQKHSFEYQNLRNFDLKEMGATISSWQQENILLNPLVNCIPKYDYDKIAPEIPLSPIKKLTPDQLEKTRVINNKNRNSRRANEDMSTIKLMNIRIYKVFDTFFINKDLFLVNFSKRYFDKTRDSYDDSVLKYENSRDFILEAVK